MNFDIDTLLNGNPTARAASLLDPATLLAPIMPFIIAMSGATIVISVLYIINVINTFRSQRATIEMRNILREMNERDKARNQQ